MKTTKLKVACAALLLSAIAPVIAQESVTPQVPDRPWTRSWWLPRFESRCALAKSGDYPVVFLGDSITHNWENQGKDVWAKCFVEGDYKALNCGFSGDRTEHVLWRLDRGQLRGLHPKVIVLMIGTNNTGHREEWRESPMDTVLGIKAIVERLDEQCPDAKVVLHPILPRGETTNDPLRIRNERVNSVIRSFADGRRILWCDFNAKLLTADGALEKSMSEDLVHPGERGYEIWAKELCPYLDYALGCREEPPRSACRQPEADYSRWWKRLRYKRKEACANRSRYYDGIWLGDDCIQDLEGTERARVLGEKLGTSAVLNVGCKGNRARDVLWDLRYGGLLQGVHTKSILLAVGANDLGLQPVVDIARDIASCLQEIRVQQPQAKVFLLPLEATRVKIKGAKDHENERKELDGLIRAFADGEKTIFIQTRM